MSYKTPAHYAKMQELLNKIMWQNIITQSLQIKLMMEIWKEHYIKVYIYIN